MKNWQVAVITACAVVITQALCAVWVSKHVEFIRAFDVEEEEDEEEEQGGTYTAWKWK
jgi:hypothetical protein